MEDLSHLSEGSLSQMGSMSASNTVSAPVKAFGAPGSHSESVLDSDIRPQADPVPPVAPANTAGQGDRGGLVDGEGSTPGAGFEWTDLDNTHAGDKWSTAVAPVEDAGH